MDFKGPRHHHHSPALSTAGIHKRAAARLPRRPLRPSPVIGRGVAAAFLHALSALELALAGAGRGVAAEDDKQTSTRRRRVCRGRPLRPSPGVGRGVAPAFLRALSPLKLALAGRGVAAEDDKAADVLCWGDASRRSGSSR